jgi:hypothetical protein
MQKLIFINSRGQSVEISNALPFILSKFDGTGSVDTSLLMTKSPYQDGSTLQDVLLDKRVLTIEGTICADSIEKMYSYRQQLASIFNPKLREGILRYENDNGVKEIKCIVEDGIEYKDKFDSSKKQTFAVSLICPNPYWLDEIDNRQDIAVWMGDFEFDLELSDDGIEMEHRENSLIVNVNNVGDVDCAIRIEFTALATVVNPSLFNIYTQKYIKVKRTLHAGDKLVINTAFGNKKVNLIVNGVTSNVFNYIDLGSTFLQLTAGDNLFRYDAESGIDNLDVSIYHRPQYIGV